MTTGLLDRKDAEDLTWRAHAHVDEYRAKDERDALHALFPKAAANLERQGLILPGRHGGLDVAPGLAEVHIDIADLAVMSGDEAIADLTKIGVPAIPKITGEMLRILGADKIGERDAIGNLLANAGINRMGGLAFGAGTGQIYNTANSAIGAGDTSTAAAATQTDLSAAVNAANRWVQIVDSQPTFASQVLTMVATFATGNGNFAWAEWAIGQNTTSAAAAITAAMLNRKVASLGTKTSAAAWAFTVTITIS